MTRRDRGIGRGFQYPRRVVHQFRDQLQIKCQAALPNLAQTGRKARIFQQSVVARTRVFAGVTADDLAHATQRWQFLKGVKARG